MLVKKPSAFSGIARRSTQVADVLGAGNSRAALAWLLQAGWL